MPFAGRKIFDLLCRNLKFVRFLLWVCHRKCLLQLFNSDCEDKVCLNSFVRKSKFVRFSLLVRHRKFLLKLFNSALFDVLRVVDDRGRFGSARAVNRRYISDCVPAKMRLKASAAFVSASALGMACGPALAGLLTFKTTILGLTFDSNTLPGWVMVVGWFVYLIFLLIGFKEPAHHPPPPARSSSNSSSKKKKSDVLSIEGVSRKFCSASVFRTILGFQSSRFFLPTVRDSQLSGLCR